MKSTPNENHFIEPRTIVVIAIILAAAAVRIVPHPMNFAPIGALALFGGAYGSNKRLAIAIPMASLIVGDFFIGFHRMIPFVYASFLLSAGIGFWLREKRTVIRIGAATLAGAIQFFLVTNFGVWALSIGSYPMTATGLAECYIAGIPLFWNTLASDAFYVALLFGGMALAERQFPVLRVQSLTRSTDHAYPMV